MRKPDFFIVGAPKCGTSAMYTYLKQHPEIFMPKVKEPRFFGTDPDDHSRTVRTLEEYLSLFTGVKDEKRVGEASAAYFYSERSAQEIKAFDPSARIMIMLRNPVDMMYSWHNQQLYERNEDLVDFEKALDAEERRHNGLCLPDRVKRVEVLFYRDIARYTRHTQRYLDAFRAENVHIIIYDDFKADTVTTYRKALHFLDVSPGFQPAFQIVNASMRVRSPALQDFLVHPPWVARRLVNAVLPRPVLQWLFSRFRWLNTKQERRAPMERGLRRRLQAECAGEVRQLGEMLGRDLSHWTTD